MASHNFVRSDLQCQLSIAFPFSLSKCVNASGNLPWNPVRSCTAKNLLPTTSSPWPSSAPPPPLLHAPNLGHIQRFYAKVNVAPETKPKRFAWVNVEIDTIYLDQYVLDKPDAESPTARQLLLLGTNSESFYHN
ncbi:hypothetical protein CSAL01_07280 [Colletotrichum salicis]|uniref:Uncharacterized protein n=1 Tax=Colletotrichum salicis TaxID=1209931 RepID=A0A135TIF7_9PEZI|nr:hypothetical protein CSAL01_07280 [Colletotrichum salicis]